MYEPPAVGGRDQNSGVVIALRPSLKHLLLRAFALLAIGMSAAVLWLSLAAQGHADPRDWLTPEERAWVSQHPVLRVGGSAMYGPFSYQDDDGRITGLSVDYARRLSELSGLRFEFQPPQTFAENLADLAEGELDLLMSLRETPERAQTLGFTRPYIQVPAVLLRRAGDDSGPLRPGEPVAVARGYAVAEFLRERYATNPLQVEADDRAVLRRLAGGEVSAAVVDLAGATYLMRRDGIGNLRVVDDIGYAYALGIGYRRDWPMLGRILDKALLRIGEGERQAIADRWITQDTEAMRWQRRALWAVGLALAAVVLGLAVVLLWNRALQRQVRVRGEQLQRELAERIRLQDVDQARALAEVTSRTKSEFLSQASHELRTPLNAVLGFSQLLASDPKRPLDELQQMRVQHIDDAARHLLVLIEDMMLLSRVESNTLTVQSLPVQAGPLLRRCVELAQPAAEAAGVALRIGMTPDEGRTLPQVQADPIRLEQVLHNLISNAIKYNRRGGWVTVRAEAAPRGFLIEVADNGLGMTVDQRSQLFQPFNRLGRVDQPGTGIGLVICKQLVERMGGRILVDSESGQGSRFTLELPAAG
ncbi:ATP-binding protein [Roseateles amylovorans]|uniref:histidine kinase n=1 Tax=Roseateles amylovorans TaxID=2978473 RepID=A0ABY6AVF9_9BURK|nr:transporter substrate-binding domain-containing protein [Roseateles amylovorans]UXH77189.1 transporter substrate-binding domain-containing protein [Roseateles amylovorans]